MPYEIRMRGGQHCVFKEGEEDSLGCHDTHHGAVKQLNALYVAEGGDFVSAAAYVEDGGEAPPAGVAEAPAAAGVALVAADTGRVLMIQRAMVDGHPSGGKWEFPGGRLEDGEAPLVGAAREFSEEVGHPLPDGSPVATWVSPDGVYQGFVWLTPEETTELVDGSRSTDDPDNPDQSNYTEATAWFDPADLRRGWNGLRHECKGTPWRLVEDATPMSPSMFTAEEVIVARAFVARERERLAEEGKALPDGSFPVVTKQDLRNAVRAYGRASDKAAAKRHIIKRARALGATDELPEGWMTASVDPIESLVASLAAPVSALLPEGELPGPTPYTVNDDGTADGHLALWASCHIGYPGCVTPPREESFDFYNLGDAVTADGQHVAVGKVTVGCGHAGPELSWRTAAAHYDESGTAVAVAHAVADRWGIRLPSVLVADADGARIDELRRSPLSGDWRRVNGSLRLVASLGVNVPGYPIPRALVAAGEVQAMFVGFSPEDAASLQLEMDSLAASLGLDHASRAERIRAELFG